MSVGGRGLLGLGSRTVAFYSILCERHYTICHCSPFVIIAADDTMLLVVGTNERGTKRQKTGNGVVPSKQSEDK